LLTPYGTLNRKNIPIKKLDEIIKKILSGEYQDPEQIKDKVGPPYEATDDLQADK
jgi:hypothetical protein